MVEHSFHKRNVGGPIPPVGTSLIFEGCGIYFVLMEHKPGLEERIVNHIPEKLRPACEWILRLAIGYVLCRAIYVLANHAHNTPPSFSANRS